MGRLVVPRLNHRSFTLALNILDYFVVDFFYGNLFYKKQVRNNNITCNKKVALKKINFEYYMMVIVLCYCK